MNEQEYSQINLPVLKGSEKQVKWANDIRNVYLELLQKFETETDENNKEASKRSLIYLGSKVQKNKSVEEYRDELIDTDPELAKYDGFKKKIRAYRKAEKLYAEVSIEASKKAIFTETNASFWIDNRLDR